VALLSLTSPVARDEGSDEHAMRCRIERCQTLLDKLIGRILPNGRALAPLPGGLRRSSERVRRQRVISTRRRQRVARLRLVR
jgi:hypothetical protein